MTKPMNIESIEKNTKRSWEQWLEFFDSINAADLSHHEIARKVYDNLVQSAVFDDQAANQAGRQNPSGWWAQNVTVAYEQHIGRRVPGQVSDGTYEVSVSKTMDGDEDSVMKWWVNKTRGLQAFNGVEQAGEPRTTTTPVARNWRIDLKDGTKVLASTSGKSNSKALFVVTSQKLTSPEAVEHWRSYWKQFLTS